MQKLIQSISEYGPYLASVVKYENEAVLNKEIVEGSETFTFSDVIEFKKVKFKYETGSKETFSDLSFSIRQGEMVGIIGPSGVGKTTIVDLILRFFRPTGGEITIDGKNISTIKLRNWRSQIGYISQDIFLLNDTIANNIRFYDDTLSDKDLERAASLANISEFIDSTPNKFETVIGERGVMLSGGQRQRIIIARILARSPRILILDEAT
ncbi:MAG: ATP-binding cassette domain-containing protein, partial [Candidatus Taylorbacteria bacterium]|nr:ATP-binding cassette domain-containing protein [Candidatus Taylorbacteria bacterium]